MQRQVLGGDISGRLVIIGVCQLLVKLHAITSMPHVIFILADDLGWNDVGFHGAADIRTPNLDALAASGSVILNNYHVAPICTPSRSALLTGKYPVHTGMQHGVLYGAEPRGLPLTEKLLPQYLHDLGYKTHMVGKWHLGSYKSEYTPLFRGFDSHFGIWTGHHDHNDHTAMEKNMWGLDLRRGLNIEYSLHGKYTTDIYIEEVSNIIKNHNLSIPLFLYMAHTAVHSGNPYNPLPVDDATVEEFSFIRSSYRRQRFAAMLKRLDDSIGQLLIDLQEKQMLENSLIVFSTDNGGPAAGFNMNSASNYPLRGVKNTLWEGGVRGTGLIWSSKFGAVSKVSYELIHITDWLPTILTATGQEFRVNSSLDGVNQWHVFIKGEKTRRTEILHNIDNVYKTASLTMGSWKIVKGCTYTGSWDGWYGPSGRDECDKYNISLVQLSLAAQAMRLMGRDVTNDDILALRSKAQINCKFYFNQMHCNPCDETCLFNLDLDPCERDNVAATYPYILAKLEQRLHEINLTAIPPSNKKLDQRGNPSKWNYVWTNFGDFNNLT